MEILVEMKIAENGRKYRRPSIFAVLVFAVEDLVLKLTIHLFEAFGRILSYTVFSNNWFKKSVQWSLIIRGFGIRE